MSNLQDMTVEELKELLELKEATVQKKSPKWTVYAPDAKGNPKLVACEENTAALFEFYGVTARYNEMSKNIEIATPGNDYVSDLSDNAYIQRVGDLARKQNYNAAVAQQNALQIAAKATYHPARDWIMSKPWDGVSRIDELISSLTLDELTDPALAKMLITKWLTACVASVMYGTRFENEDHTRYGFKGTEGVLVLQGEQGLAKTKWLASLIPHHEHWFSEGEHLDPKDKDVVLRVVGRWICELGELDATFKAADHAALKAFITKKEDKMRPAYAHKADTYPRRTVFCATVNDREILKYDDESRRYWMLGVTAVNVDHGINIQQLWAEVYETLYMECYPYWLLPMEREALYESNKSFTVQSSTVQLLDRYARPPSGSRVGEWLPAIMIGQKIGAKASEWHVCRDVGTWCKKMGIQKRTTDNNYFIYINTSSWINDNA
jgi:putative DNA primase/helicase